MMMMALGFRVPLSVKEYSIQAWQGQLTGHHFWLSHHCLQLHNDTLIKTRSQRGTDKKKDRQINTQTQLGFSDPLSLLLYYRFYYFTILGLKYPKKIFS